MSEQEFITVIQLAERLMIPKATAYYLVQSGKIPGAFKVGKHWRLNRKMVDEWIDGQIRRQLTERDHKLKASEGTRAANLGH